LFKREKVLDRALLRRVAVNFLDNPAMFTGRLAEYDGETYVLEACETVAGPGETAQPIKGRQYVDRIHCWLQELPT
jgi:hypothetical protein